jgi:hypothetical protein
MKVPAGQAKCILLKRTSGKAASMALQGRIITGGKNSPNGAKTFNPLNSVKKLNPFDMLNPTKPNTTGVK